MIGRETTIYWLANDAFYVYTDEGLQAMTDAERESLIDSFYEQMIAATEPSVQLEHWREMLYHIKLRSPEQVYRMEVERRISAKWAPLFTYDLDGGRVPA